MPTGSWSSTTIAAEPSVAWQIQPIGALPAWANEAEHTQAKERLGPITPVTVAEGVLAVAAMTPMKSSSSIRRPVGALAAHG